MPGAVLRLLVHHLEPPPRLEELLVVMPGLPVLARLPGADDHALVRLLGRRRHLNPNEARLVGRGPDALAQRRVPRVLLTVLNNDVRHDRLHSLLLSRSRLDLPAV